MRPQTARGSIASRAEANRGVECGTADTSTQRKDINKTRLGREEKGGEAKGIERAGYRDRRRNWDRLAPRVEHVRSVVVGGVGAGGVQHVRVHRAAAVCQWHRAAVTRFESRQDEWHECFVFSAGFPPQTRRRLYITTLHFSPLKLRVSVPGAFLLDCLGSCRNTRRFTREYLTFLPLVSNRRSSSRPAARRTYFLQLQRLLRAPSWKLDVFIHSARDTCGATRLSFRAPPAHDTNGPSNFCTCVRGELLVPANVIDCPSRAKFKATERSSLALALSFHASQFGDSKLGNRHWPNTPAAWAIGLLSKADKLEADRRAPEILEKRSVLRRISATSPCFKFTYRSTSKDGGSEIGERQKIIGRVPGAWVRQGGALPLESVVRGLMAVRPYETVLTLGIPIGLPSSNTRDRADAVDPLESCKSYLSLHKQSKAPTI
ncbi:hypothetical protein C8F04DRAFT_1190512 [Mycena alexandri]|uniref:Uncharacterized protein n=1 Tax=Mycena alexandri TaxID=1745969 RepID=A0AAD6SEE6_9AGAR|nr:hypothetical protein C8F04DRAFT_1190512 [Mycena alexandri]